MHFWPNHARMAENSHFYESQTVHGFLQTRPEGVKPCTDGSFPLIVVKHTRQVVRIEVMRADLLRWRDVDGDFWLRWI